MSTVKIQFRKGLPQKAVAVPTLPDPSRVSRPKTFHQFIGQAGRGGLGNQRMTGVNRRVGLRFQLKSQANTVEVCGAVRDVLENLGEDPVFEDPEEPDGPLSAGLDALYDSLRPIYMIDGLAAEYNGRFTRSDVYMLMSRIIRNALMLGSDWVIGSEASWRFTDEAFQTRSSEVFGDKMTTAFPELAVGDPDFGIAERTCNVLDLALRRLASMYNSQSKDRDLGPNGEMLTPGECIRLAYTALDTACDYGVVPNDPSSAFMLVRKECYDQYKAMGEGVFGPLNVPGGPVPWSWAG